MDANEYNIDRWAKDRPCVFWPENESGLALSNPGSRLFDVINSFHIPASGLKTLFFLHSDLSARRNHEIHLHKPARTSQ